MKMLLIPLFLILLCSNTQSQQIRQITGVKTYLYEQKDYEPVKIDSNIVIRYDEKGRLLRHSRKEEICHEYFSYNEKDQLLEEKSYCGEGFSECKIEIKDNIKTTRCFTNYHESIQIDSLDEKGRIFHSKIETNSELDTNLSLTTTSFSLYEYDKNGNEIYSMHEGNGHRQIVQRNFSENGKLKYLIQWEKSINQKDSIVYSYDESNRIMEMKAYRNILKDGTYQKFEGLNILYSPLKINKTIKENQKFNDTLLNNYLPYSPFTYELSKIINPVEITYSVLDMSDPSSLSKINYQYGYDNEGRLTAITGKDLSGVTSKPIIESVIGYFPEDRILFSKKEYWSSYIYQSHHEYLKGHLQKIIELDAKDETRINARHEFTYDYFK
jgi:hypothetical protein